MKFRILIYLSLLFFSSTSLTAQQPQADSEGSLVKWISITEAMEKIKTQPRPIILDFYTDWCGWCKRMMQTTYANPGLAQYINTNFYAVKFNAESKDTIEYLGQKYGPSSEAPKAAHSLAIKLLQGKLMYPTTLFLNIYDKQKNEFVFSMIAQGYLDTKKIEPILVFQLENAFRNSAFEEFEANYYKAFYDTSTNSKLESLKWQKPVEFFANTDSSKKKTLVFIHTEWCNACRVMHRTSFAEERAFDSLDKKFNLVDFNPEISDQIKFKGQLYYNLRSPQSPFHQLATALCRNSLTLPTVVVMDEKMIVLDAIPFYLNPKVLGNIVTYYGDNIFKVKSWTDFNNGLKQ